MISRLSGGQRIWLMFAVVLLASTIALIAIVWPTRDAGVVADLGSAECASWRGMPPEQMPDVYPEPGQPCYGIRSLMFHEHVRIATLEDYDSYLTRRGATTAAWLLLIWALASAAGYALAWSSARAVKAFGARGRSAG
jgi:hypothetical protein